MKLGEGSELAVPVLVVGAGPAGLVESLLLGRHEIPVLQVERREDISELPKATGINMRTMEILRGLGLEDEVMNATTDTRVDLSSMPLWVAQETLAGEVLHEEPFVFPTGRGAEDYPSPSAHQHLGQDRMDAMLLAAAQRSETVDVRYGNELLSFEQDEDGVRARVRELASQREYMVYADYLIAADGARSTVRAALGIEMQGEIGIERQLAILFEADIGHLVRREAGMMRIANDRMQGVFRRVEGNRWTVTTPSAPASASDHTREVVLELIRAGVGDPELEPEILGWQAWELNAASAERYRDGRVFLIGDAAHQVTPGGALGANTSMQDAHNLAWKLAAVREGWAAASLLDSYALEREPIGKRNAALSLEIWRSRTAAIAGVVLGVNYEEGALIPDGTSLPETDDPVGEYLPSARPGSRAPHFWLEDGVSTIDIFEGVFTVLTADPAWVEPAEAVAARRGLPHQVRVEANPELAELYGIGSRGAVLVRPDGHVAWRTTDMPEDPAGQLDAVYESITGVASSREPTRSAA